MRRFIVRVSSQDKLSKNFMINYKRWRTFFYLKRWLDTKDEPVYFDRRETEQLVVMGSLNSLRRPTHLKAKIKLLFYHFVPFPAEFRASLNSTR